MVYNNFIKEVTKRGDILKSAKTLIFFLSTTTIVFNMSPTIVKIDPLEVWCVIYDVDKPSKNLMVPIGLNDKYEEFYLK